MNSFTLHAVANLARDPEVNTKGDKTYTRICLLGTDFNGRDADGSARELLTSCWMVAFGAVGLAIAKSARKGDQLIVQARMRANNWSRGGEKHFDYSFTVESFRFGAPGKAKREEFRSSRHNLTNSTLTDPTNADDALIESWLGKDIDLADRSVPDIKVDLVE
jgi:single-strand DNA-binding protein